MLEMRGESGVCVLFSPSPLVFIRGSHGIFLQELTLHYYINLYRGGQKALTEVVFATSSVVRPRLIVAFTEAVAKIASVNALNEAVFYNSTASVNRIKK
jgi:hypothetical protein